IQRAEIFLNTMDMPEIKKLISKSEKLCNDKCQLTGSLISYNEFSVKILHTLLSSLGLSVFLVILILFLIRKPLTFSEVFCLIVSSIWGPLTLLSLFIIFKIPISFVTCICASLLVGLTGDNAIQFIFNTKKSNLNQSIDSFSDASLIVTIGMIFLVSIFLISEIASLGTLGGYIMLGFLLGFIGDVWILKGILKND
ncbi:MAG: hypothetical protein KDD45_09265, partial [Bdellovibrionales bacterium]|nr:hypothetical protein [Bdellovibrionales bacterium]